MALSTFLLVQGDKMDIYRKAQLIVKTGDTETQPRTVFKLDRDEKFYGELELVNLDLETGWYVNDVGMIEGQAVFAPLPGVLFFIVVAILPFNIKAEETENRDRGGH